jgi:hypothetical protein
LSPIIQQCLEKRYQIFINNIFKRVIYSVVLIFQITYLFPSEISIHLEKSFFLEQTTEATLGRIYDMAIDEEENIYIPDSSFSNIKIFNKTGKLLNIFGRKGAGPSEFVSPTKIAIDQHTICIQDTGQLKYIILDRNFEELARCFYLLSGHTFVLDGEKIIANEFYRDKKGQRYRGVILDFKGKVMQTLIPLKGSQSDALEVATDSLAFIDISRKGNIFLAKSGRVFIYKFDTNGKLLKNFGLQPAYFKPPQKTKDFDVMLKWGRAPQGRTAGEHWYKSSSWVSGLFVLDEILGIIIRSFNQEEGKWDCYIQLYDLDGNIIEDGIRLPEIGNSTNTGFFLRSNHIDTIYILEESPDEPVQFQFFRYKVEH